MEDSCVGAVIAVIALIAFAAFIARTLYNNTRGGGGSNSRGGPTDQRRK